MRVLIGMSGGVDSSVAALLLKQAGHTPVGVMLRLLDEAKGEEAARAVAEKIGMEFYVEDLQREFKEQVIKPFIEGYLEGSTPNPCIDCNKFIKFGAMFETAKKHGCEKIATGHYAVIEEEKGIFHLKKAADAKKDQSYMLYNLTQEKLSRVLLPLGGKTKEQIRLIAEENGFSNAKAKDSQDICFVPDGDYAGFIERELDCVFPEGDFVNEKGEPLGKHRGCIRYTVGQRKGLGLSLPAPLYVLKKQTDTNLVFLGEEASLMKSEIILTDCNFLCEIDEAAVYSVKIRYGQKETEARVRRTGEKSAKIHFLSPVRAPARGQSAVIYKNNEVIAGGKITTKND